MMIVLFSLLVRALLFHFTLGMAAADRQLGQRLTTTKCPSLRATNFKASLDLYYFYIVEAQTEDSLNLNYVELAIGRQLVNALSDCDSAGQPRNAVQLSESHRFSSGGDCIAHKEGSICRVVRGMSSILLDENPAAVEAKAYDAIATTLQSGLNLPIERGLLIQHIGENLVLFDEAGATTPPSTGSNVLFVALTSTMTILAVAAAFAIGVRRRGRAIKLRLGHEQAKRRHFFGQLQEEGRSDPEEKGGWMTTDALTPQPPHIPSTTWSVSDLTSDSHSIKSSLKMDRIDEESDSEQDSNPSNSASDQSFEAECDEEGSPERSDSENDGFVGGEGLFENQQGDCELGCQLNAVAAGMPEPGRTHISEGDVTGEQAGFNLMDDSSLGSSTRSIGQEFLLSVARLFPSKGDATHVSVGSVIEEKVEESLGMQASGSQDLESSMEQSMDGTSTVSDGVSLPELARPLDNKENQIEKSDADPPRMVETGYSRQEEDQTVPVLAEWSQKLIQRLSRIQNIKNLPSP